jgi:mono/diheme cytochrome c family protein
MTGGRRSLASVSALLILMACGGGRERGAPATGSQTSDTAAAALRDTTGAPAPETGAGPAERDTAATARATSPSVAQTPPAKPTQAPKKPAPVPASPALGTGAGAPAESTHATAPAAEGSPLRDAYHQAPLDTVSQQVYQGWKQFNLNCARCHGEDVQGTTIAPHLIVSLRPDGSIPTKELFVQTVCAGRPAKGMPAWCSLGLEMDKIEAIYSYVKGRSDSKIHQGRPAVKQ